MSKQTLIELRGAGRRGAVASGVGLAAVAAVGVTVLIVFFRQLLAPGDLGSLSLPVVAVMAGLAATFNPCGLPALPGFLEFLGGDDEKLEEPAGDPR